MRLPWRKSKRRKPLSKLAAGVIGIVVLAVFVYGGFTKFANPFASHFTIHAVVPSSNDLRPNSLVRIAGVNVGKVESISSINGSRAAEVNMTLEDNGQPLHSDATFWIRPRIFLEGNFFVDVSPGSPNAPVVKNDHVFPLQQTREPVQLDQILGSLQANTRQNLQVLLKEYGNAVYTAGPAFARSVQYWLPAYKYSAIVEHDLLGLNPQAHDLSTGLYEQGTVSQAFNSHPQDLQSLITDFNTTAGALARQSSNLQRTVALLPGTLDAAMPAFHALNAAFPPVERLAIHLIPGVRTAGPTIDASLPFIHQLRLLVQPSELRGLTHDLAPTIPALANLTNQTIPLMRDQVRPASSCVVQDVIPWSNLQINDSNFNASNGFPPHPAYVEDLQLLPGIAGESRTFDGNGPIIRLLFGGGTFTYSIQPGAFGSLLSPLVGVQPVPPPNNQRPPLAGGDVPNAPCETQAPISTLDSPAGPPPAQINTTSPLPTLPISLPLQQTTDKLLGAEVANSLKATGSSLKLKGDWASPATQSGSSGSSSGSSSSGSGGSSSSGTGSSSSSATGSSSSSGTASSSSSATTHTSRNGRRSRK
jgi:phospholipid/cholesterol/gamma-HCH transport system substrate-binding protein